MKFLFELTLRRRNLDVESHPDEHPQGTVGSSAHVVPVDQAKIASNGKIIIPCCGDKNGTKQFSPHPSLALNYRMHTWQMKLGNAILVGN